MKIKELIEKLVEVQKFDREKYLIKVAIEEDKPEELTQLEEEFLVKRETLTAAEGIITQAQLKKKDAELQGQTKRDGLIKSEGDLYKLKSNDEYKIKLTEIEKLKQDISEAEDVELEIMEEMSSFEANVKEAKEAFALEEKKHDEQKASIEKEIKELEERQFVLKDKLAIASRELSGKYWDRYSQLIIGSGGLAIVPYASNSCGGCFMSLPPDIGNKIKTYENIIFCDHCGRMLYLEDDIYYSDVK